MRLSKEYKAGTGNSRVTIPKSEQIRLNNTPIFITEAVCFTKQITKSIPSIVFSRRKTKSRWGTAFSFPQRKIILYRHSVYIFLHELAHVLCGGKEKHSRVFGRKLDHLYELWCSYKEKNDIINAHAQTGTGGREGKDGKLL